MLSITQLSTPIPHQTFDPNEVWASIHSVDSEELGRALKYLKYAKFLRTPYWDGISREVKARGGHRCQMCNSPEGLQAHHRTYEHRGFEHLHLDDLLCVCHSCHKRYHLSRPAIIEKFKRAKWLKRERKKALRSALG